MVKFPLNFEVEARSKAGIGEKWEAKMGSLPPIACAIPPDFSGPGGGYSPEDLFGISVINCLIAMFKVYCERSKLGFDEIRARAIVTADKAADEPLFVIKNLDIFIEVDKASDPEKIRKTLDEAIRDCPISNSIKSSKAFHIKIS